ncbi:hypothetical protein K443DRAFT_226634 [Laccaria amethystina LaAM-08-1]|uniref:Unplaced genomic scaffold K443scaffold_147, whole genome shotgun sequence n=1 Tax=Laccaria amethystina LaAM-08-1 TaxID=1095629 RepID=A0A0C9WM59_9AGAR|nr:hypothetical protein K443DRAFT_226634 [Laccaria amethystina LaAM-08-1]
MLEQFAHPFVMLFKFSPCEQELRGRIPQSRFLKALHKVLSTFAFILQIQDLMLLSLSSAGPQYFSPADEGSHNGVWENATGNLLQTFPTIKREYGGLAEKPEMHCPSSKWSPDDKYVARVSLVSRLASTSSQAWAWKQRKASRLKLLSTLNGDRSATWMGRPQRATSATQKTFSSTGHRKLRINLLA